MRFVASTRKRTLFSVDLSITKYTKQKYEEQFEKYTLINYYLCKLKYIPITEGEKSVGTSTRHS